MSQRVLGPTLARRASPGSPNHGMGSAYVCSLTLTDSCACPCVPTCRGTLHAAATAPACVLCPLDLRCYCHAEGVASTPSPASPAASGCSYLLGRQCAGERVDSTSYRFPIPGQLLICTHPPSLSWSFFGAACARVSHSVPAPSSACAVCGVGVSSVPRDATVRRSGAFTAPCILPPP